MPRTHVEAPRAGRSVPLSRIVANPFSLGIYGESQDPPDDLLEAIRREGILVPPVVTPDGSAFVLVSGHRRIACARALGLRSVPCEVRSYADDDAVRRAVLDYNRQRRKTFSQSMREADALEHLLAGQAEDRRLANLRPQSPERRDSDARPAGRTDTAVARAIGLGGKDIYRQARAVWAAAAAEDPRAVAAVAGLDAGTKTVHAAYKDLRRRGRYTTGFRPTPYDIWSFRHDPTYGIPHPGSIPPAIIAHAIYYFSPPDGLVVDPMAGGGTTLDVARDMGRRCLAYDLAPTRPDIARNDISKGLPDEARGCDLCFCDPPYHTMLAGRYLSGSAADNALSGWIAFLQTLAENIFRVLRPGGHIALLLANQTEKDLPVGHGYIDHVVTGYNALVAAGFQPERRIHCPMSGAYLPQHVRRARVEGRMLGQVRDLLVMRKPARAGDQSSDGSCAASS